MLGIFSGKSDHPLVNPKSARELFERLARADPLEAIDEIDSWLESTSRDEKIKPRRRAELLFQLDDIGIAAARRLAREYLLLSAGGQGQNYKLWQANSKYWHRLVEVYSYQIEQGEADKKLQDELRASLPAIYVRLLRAYFACLKWDQFRYGPIDVNLWQAAGKLYLQAEAENWLDKKLDCGDGVQTTIAAEYLKLLLFQASSMDRLQPQEIELAEQLLVHFLQHFSLTKQVRPENVYWVDSSKPIPPTRLAKLPEVTPTLRFFATASALSAIEAMRSEISATQALPKSLVLNQLFPVPAVISILQHLEVFCSPQPLMRSHTRHQVKSWMGVVSGFQASVAALRGDRQSDGSWAVEDVSHGGLRAIVELSGHVALGISSLVAMCPDGGGNWLIGVVRRISRENQTKGSVGIEIISKAAAAVKIDSSGLAGDALLLSSTLASDEITQLVVSPGVWQDHMPITFKHDGGSYRLRPMEEQQRGNDYVIGRYWVDVLSG